MTPTYSRKIFQKDYATFIETLYVMGLIQGVYTVAI